MLLFAACTDSGVSAQAGEGAREDGTVAGKVDETVALKQGPGRPGDAGYVTFRMGSATAGRGQTVCLPVEVTGFNELIGYQYTMAYDSASLRYQSVRSLNLPGYSQNNFGTRFADRGVVSTLWTDNALAGTTLKAGHRLYEICFENLMPAGERASVRFQDGPTAFEVIDKEMGQLRFTYADGEVISK